MKILVAVKRTVDSCVKVRVKRDGSALDIASARRSINPFDAIALEEAVRLKERGQAGEVLAVSVGPPGCRDILRLALSQGADRALWIETADGDLPPLAVARLLRVVCERESPRLVLCGKQAIDDDAAQTGPMLAAKMGWPQAAFASEIRIESDPPDRAIVTRETDEGTETVEIALPAVITADLRLNTPRFASLSESVRARKKPIETLTPDALGVDIATRLETLGVCEPPPRAPGIRVRNVMELTRFLKERGFA